MRYWLLGILLCSCITAQADWKLDKAASSLSFVSIKNNEIGEVSHFNSIDADIQNDGILTMIVNLDSVDSRFRIRDEQLRKLLFETNKYSVASVKGRMPVKKLTKMAAGDTERLTVKVMLNLHGQQEVQTIDMRVIKKKGKRFLAVTESPVLIHAQAFGLTNGIKQLVQAVQLETITWVVPVTFALEFQ